MPRGCEKFSHLESVMTLVLSQVIPDMRGAESAIRYLGNRYCISHRSYQIWFPAALNRCGSTNFLATLDWAMSILQRESKLIRPADWLVASFRPRSFLTDRECATLDRVWSEGLCPDGFSIGAWHRNQNDGRADLNLVLPRTKLVCEVPLLRRWQARPVLSTAIELATAAIRAVNKQRSAEDRILEPAVARAEASLRNGVEPLAVSLARIAYHRSEPLKETNLVRVLSHAGFAPHEFELGSGILILKRGRRRQIRIEKLISDVEAFRAFDAFWLHPDIFTSRDEGDTLQRKAALSRKSPQQQNAYDHQLIQVR